MTTTLLANHAWQSTIVAGIAWLITIVLQRNRASVRHAVWLAASLKFLVPFALLVNLGSHLEWRTTPVQAPQPIVYVVDAIGQPFSPAVIQADTKARPAAGRLARIGPVVVFAVWFAGCAMVLFVWCARWRRVNVTVRGGIPMAQGSVVETLRRLERSAGVGTPIVLVSTPSSLEPGVFGIAAPVLLWPRQIAGCLAGSQIEAILAHEVSHVRRRDNLWAAAHMVVQAVFWFHPLVWWMGSRLMDERERACDEDVVRLGSEPRAYAESILEVSRFYAESPLTCVAGVTGSDLKKRIEQIMRNDYGTRLSGWKRVLLTTSVAAAVAVPVAFGVLTASARAQTPVSDDREAAARQSDATAGKPAFDVASVKLNTSGDGRVLMMPQPGGRLNLVNVPLRLLIRNAYGVQDFQIVGGPDWLSTTRFDIVAKAETGNPGQDELRLMLRSLLADRFKLVVRSEKREMPIFALVTARSDGKPGAQLRQSDADCSGPASTPAGPPAAGQMPRCGFMAGFGNLKARGSTLAALASTLSTFAGRIVVDRTAIAGGYDIDLTWTPDQIPRAQGGDQPVQVNGTTIDPNGPSLFTALQEQLGLKLESTKGAVEVLVVDRAEKPTED